MKTWQPKFLHCLCLLLALPYIQNVKFLCVTTNTFWLCNANLTYCYKYILELSTGWSNKKKLKLKSRPFDFLLVVRSTGAWQIDRNFVVVHTFLTSNCFHFHHTACCAPVCRNGRRQSNGLDFPASIRMWMCFYFGIFCLYSSYSFSLWQSDIRAEWKMWYIYHVQPTLCTKTRKWQYFQKIDKIEFYIERKKGIIHLTQHLVLEPL